MKNTRRWLLCVALTFAGCGFGGAAATQQAVETPSGDPSTPACDGVDNDGDGQIDEGCDCAPDSSGQTRCDPGTDPTDGETCGDGTDDNGDGQIDERCGDEDPCAPDASGQRPAGCDGSTDPCDPATGAGCGRGEVCGNGLDDDGNGLVDEGCDTGCEPRPDGSLPPGCGCDHPGDPTGPCDPSTGAGCGGGELCGNGRDDDGDGAVDEDCGGDCTRGPDGSLPPGCDASGSGSDPSRP